MADSLLVQVLFWLFLTDYSLNNLISNSRFALNPSKYAVHVNAFRKLLGSNAMDYSYNLFILHHYFFGGPDDFS